jgi:hypothetical protein
MRQRSLARLHDVDDTVQAPHSPSGRRFRELGRGVRVRGDLLRSRAWRRRGGRTRRAADGRDRANDEKRTGGTHGVNIRSPNRPKQRQKELDPADRRWLAGKLPNRRPRITELRMALTKSRLDPSPFS